jgi:hypothetical protein
MITLANAQAETVFGYRRAELVAKPVEMLIPKAADCFTRLRVLAVFV